MTDPRKMMIMNTIQMMKQETSQPVRGLKEAEIVLMMSGKNYLLGL